MCLCLISRTLHRQPMAIQWWCSSYSMQVMHGWAKKSPILKDFDATGTAEASYTFTMGWFSKVTSWSFQQEKKAVRSCLICTPHTGVSKKWRQEPGTWCNGQASTVTLKHEQRSLVPGRSSSQCNDHEPPMPAHILQQVYKTTSKPVWQPLVHVGISPCHRVSRHTMPLRHSYWEKTNAP